MSLTQIDQRNQGTERLLEQFKDKPNIVGTLNSYLTQTNDIEKVTFQLLNNRLDVSTITGTQLDILGGIVGEPRFDRSDLEYRKAINFRIGINNSQPTPKYLTELCKDATESSSVSYFEYYPNTFSIEFNGDSIPKDFLYNFTLASPTCSNPLLIHNIDDRGLVFSEDGDSSGEEVLGVLPEDGDSLGLFLSEGYSKDYKLLEPVTPTPSENILKSTVGFSKHTGNDISTDVNLGIDLSTEDFAVFFGTTASQNYLEVFTTKNEPLAPSSNSSYSLFTGTSSIGRSNCEIVGNPSGYTTTGNYRPNFAQGYWSLGIKRSAGVCDIIRYTGDGLPTKTLTHILGVEPCYFIVLTATSNSSVQYYKGMEVNEFQDGTLRRFVGGIWGGSLPTNEHITVGDIGNEGVNVLGVEYVLIAIADNPNEGITHGEYISTGVAGQEVDLGNRLGFYQSASSGGLVSYNKELGVSGIPLQITNTTAGAVQTINEGGTKIILGGNNVHTNNISARKYYWFNITDPDYL